MVIREVEYEHDFSNKVSIGVQTLSWTSPLLIYLTNGYLISITMKQRNKSALDVLMLMDSFLCIFNSLVIIRVLHAISFARNDFLSSIQGEQAVRALLKTENILKRLLKSKPESSSRIFF